MSWPSRSQSVASQTRLAVRRASRMALSLAALLPPSAGRFFDPKSHVAGQIRLAPPRGRNGKAKRRDDLGLNKIPWMGRVQHPHGGSPNDNLLLIAGLLAAGRTTTADVFVEDARDQALIRKPFFHSALFEHFEVGGGHADIDARILPHVAPGCLGRGALRPFLVLYGPELAALVGGDHL